MEAANAEYSGFFSPSNISPMFEAVLKATMGTWSLLTIEQVRPEEPDTGAQGSEDIKFPRVRHPAAGRPSRRGLMPVGKEGIESVAERKQGQGAVGQPRS